MISPNKRLCTWREPTELASKLVEYWGEEGMIWLDGDGSAKGRWATLAVDPIKHICCHGLPHEKNASNPFNALRKLDPGHWTGWLSYEAGAWVEPQNPWKSDVMSTLWLACHDPILRFDLQEHKLWVEGCDIKRLKETINFIESIPINNVDKNNSKEFTRLSIPIKNWQWVHENTNYANNVQLIKDLISKGDIFQANLSLCGTTTISKNTKAIDLFQKIRRKCLAPFSGLVVGAGDAINEAVISTSPEQFVKVLPTGQVETRPIKGTRPRHLNPQKDAEFAADLICSLKDRSENLMIVDLLRNDLGRVCQPGSIAVSKLMGLESYMHVHHLTSVVKGQLQVNKTWIDLLEACWPGGSISGAPKLRACQRLHELEPTPRGPYCGSLLHLDWNGQLNSNILIRSLMLKEETLRIHAGCGIVADSDPDNEVAELNWKLLPLLESLQ